MALIKNNAKIGSLIAVEYCKIRKLKEKRKAVVGAMHSVPMLVVAPLWKSFASQAVKLKVQ